MKSSGGEAGLALSGPFQSNGEGKLGQLGTLGKASGGMESADIRKLDLSEALKDIKDLAKQGTVSFSITLKNVDEPVTIDAPESGKPLEELMKQLQQRSARRPPHERAAGQALGRRLRRPRRVAGPRRRSCRGSGGRGRSPDRSRRPGP